MKASVKKVKDCRVRLTVEVEPAMFEERYKEVLKQFQREAALPGFRAGKAPVDLVEKKYAREAEEETIKAVIPEVYHQAVLKEELSPVSMPSISDIKFERGKKLTFIAEFDTAPEFSLKNYKGIRLKKVASDVEPGEVEKGLQSLLESRAEILPLPELRAARQGDFIISDVETWKDGQYAPARKGVMLQVEPNPTDDFFDQVVGASVDEVREISVDPTEEDKQRGLVGRKPMYKIWIREIREKKLPLMDDQLAKQFGLENVDALREAVRKDIARHKLGQSQARMKEELFEKLLALTTFNVPEALIERQKERLIEQTRKQMASMGMPPARIESELEGAKQDTDRRAAEQVKLYFILQKVAELEGIDADESEVEGRLQGLAEESKRPLDEVRQVFEEDIRESLKEKGTIDFLLANAKFEEKA